jgi:hypothetical protein
MRTIVDNKAMLKNTHNDISAEAEVDNFKENVKFDAFLANNRIPMKWNGKIYIGQMHGMEFTSAGPDLTVIKERGMR